MGLKYREGMSPAELAAFDAEQKAEEKTYADAARFDAAQSAHQIDLKHSIWSAHKEHWEEYAPKTLAALQGVADGDLEEYGGRLTIHSAPRKEIRSGTVSFYIAPDGRYKGHLVADVDMRTDWDEPYALAGTLLELAGVRNPTDAQIEELAQEGSDASHFHGAHHVDAIDFGDREHTLAEILEGIDYEEDVLLKADKREWNSLVEWAKERYAPKKKRSSRPARRTSKKPTAKKRASKRKR